MGAPQPRDARAEACPAPPWSRLGWPAPPRVTRRQAAGLLGLTLLAIGLRGAVLPLVPAIDPTYHGVTSQEYFDVARNFVTGRGWRASGKAATVHPPGYSLYLAAPVAVSATRAVPLARAGQVALDSCVVLLVWAVARRAGPPRAAWGAAAAYAALPEFVGGPAPLLAEAMMPAWLAAGVYAAARWAETAQFRWATGLGLAAAGAMLWRGEALVAAPAAMLLSVGMVRGWRRALAGGAVTAVVIGGLYGPWMLWRSRLWTAGEPQPSPMSTALIEGLGQFPNRFGLRPDDRFIGAIMHYQGLPWQMPEGAAYCVATARRIIAADPLLPVRSALGRQWAILSRVSLPYPIAVPGLQWANQAALLLGAGLGLYGLATERIRWWSAALLAGPLLLYCGTIGVVYYEARYVAPGHVSLLWLGTAAFGPRGPRGIRRGVVAGAVVLAAALAGGLALDRRTNAATVARLALSADAAPWRPAEPATWPGATLEREAEGSLVISGPGGAPGSPGFIVVWPPIPTAPKAVASVVVELEVLAGGAKVGLFQTVQFPRQPPEHLWLATQRVAGSGRQAIVLPAENLTAQPLQLGLIPDVGDGGGPGAGATESACRVRIRKIGGWPNERGPSRPWRIPWPPALSPG